MRAVGVGLGLAACASHAQQAIALYETGDYAAAARAAVIGDAPVRVGIEAAVREGWDALIGAAGVFIGMTGFGASAPAKDLYRHFGITAERTAEAAAAALR